MPNAVSIDRQARPGQGRNQTPDRAKQRVAFGDDSREDKTFKEYVIGVDRVARVVKGGRRFRFKALVAVGDGKKRIGIGVAKGIDVQVAVAKAVEKAKRKLMNITTNGSTIPHEVEAKVGGAMVLLKPAAPGTGVIAGGTVRAIISLTGITDLLSKALGSNNKVNNSYATLAALKQLVAREDWKKSTVTPKKESGKTEPEAKDKKETASGAKAKESK